MVLGIVIAIVSGIFLSIQPALNAQLATKLDAPYLSATISFAVGTLALVLVCFVVGQYKPASSTPLSEYPWYLWTGGLLGAFFVAASLIFLPKLGALQWFSLAVLGQAVASILIDKYGYFNMPKIDLNPSRIVGMVLVLVGTFLVSRK